MPAAQTKCKVSDREVVHQYFTHFTTDVVSHILNHSTFAEPETRKRSFRGNFCY